MLGFFTILIMLGVAYAYLREGLLTAFAMLINVLIAGTVAFNFFEPIASMMEPTLSNTFFAGYEDFVCMTGIFAITLGPSAHHHQCNFRIHGAVSGSHAAARRSRGRPGRRLLHVRILDLCPANTSVAPEFHVLRVGK